MRAIQTDRFRRADIDAFLRLAAEEGWLCDPWEFDFLLGTFPDGCFAVRDEEGAVAFVTAVSYGTSGWIGNLIVRSDRRGLGIGKELMKRAIAALQRAGTETIWLTASRAGAPIYGKLGFTAVDEIRRWAGYGSAGDIAAGGTIDFEGMLETDRAGWGGDRKGLLLAVSKRGTSCGSLDGFIVRQKCGGVMQLGPWGGRSIDGAAPLLEWALIGAGAGASLALDVPAGNVAAARLLENRGFTSREGTLLMFLGRPAAYRPDYVYALASMGSIG